MSRLLLRKSAALIIALALFFSTFPLFSADVYAAFDTIISVDLNVTFGQSDARSMLAMINDFRTGSEAWEYTQSNTKYYHKGLAKLTYDYELERIAMQRAAEIAIYFDHTRPDGSDCMSAYTDAFMYAAKGENIAMGYDYPARDVFTSWKEDNEPYSGQGHRRNMLLPDYRSVGIGHVIYNGMDYWVQEFSDRIVDTAYVAPNDSAGTVTVRGYKSLITGEEPEEFTCGDFKYIVSDYGDSMITACNASGDVVIPEYVDGHMVTALAPELFYDRSGITSVYIPATVEYFDLWCYVFSCCYDLKAINVDRNNPTLKSVDGVLYSKDMSILYNYPAAKEGKSYTVPAVTETLDDESFAFAPLEKLIIENPETGWYPYAFYGDDNLVVIYKRGGTSQMLVESGTDYGPAFMADPNYIPPYLAAENTPVKAVIKSLKSGRKSAKLTIRNMSGGVTYTVQYRIKGKKKWKTKTISKTSATFKKLKSGKKYQFRVRACKTVNGITYYGNWSKTKTVKIR